MEPIKNEKPAVPASSSCSPREDVPGDFQRARRLGRGESWNGFLGVVLVLGGGLLVGMGHLWNLAWICPIRWMTGLACPGCGMTRALRALAAGDLDGSWRWHPLLIPTLIIVLILAAGSGWNLLVQKRRQRRSKTSLRFGGLSALVRGFGGSSAPVQGQKRWDVFARRMVVVWCCAMLGVWIWRIGTGFCDCPELSWRIPCWWTWARQVCMGFL